TPPNGRISGARPMERAAGARAPDRWTRSRTALAVAVLIQARLSLLVAPFPDHEHLADAPAVDRLDRQLEAADRDHVTERRPATRLQDGQEILGVEDADDFVDRFLVDRDPAVALVDDLVDRLVKRGRRGQRDDRDPRDHDLVEAPLAELDDRVDHLLLLGLED